jgi:DNA transposition AAA+ family ATPase
LIIDESERFSATSLELLRDRYDRDKTALILIGMPGIEKWFSRYPQLYSRIGFAHGYPPLAQEELHFVLDRRWHKLGQTLDPEDFTDAQAVAAVARITRGNFRLIDRLFTQVDRIMKITSSRQSRTTSSIRLAQTSSSASAKTANRTVKNRHSELRVTDRQHGT